MLYDGVSLIPVFVIVILLNFLLLQLMFFHHKLTDDRQNVHTTDINKTCTADNVVRV